MPYVVPHSTPNLRRIRRAVKPPRQKAGMMPPKADRNTPQDRVARGRRLAAARVQAGMDQEAAADAAGISTTTLSRWERGKQPVDGDVEARLFSIYWAKSGKTAPRVDHVSELTPTYAPALPKNSKILIDEFVLELRHADVSDELIEQARRSLNAPENYRFFVGGEASEYTEEEIIQNLEAFMGAISDILRLRGYKKVKKR